MSQSLPEIIATLRLPNTPRRSIDVGCGIGNEVRQLAKLGFDAFGIDTNPAALAKARNATEEELSVTWIEARAENLPFDDSSITLVTDRGCMHHIKPSNLCE